MVFRAASGVLVEDKGWLLSSLAIDNIQADTQCRTDKRVFNSTAMCGRYAALVLLSTLSAFIQWPAQSCGDHRHDC